MSQLVPFSNFGLELDSLAVEGDREFLYGYDLYSTNSKMVSFSFFFF